MPLNRKDGRSFIDTIVMMGRKMGLVVLAEGVERKEQIDYLMKHKCHRAQGYYISKPMPEEQAILLCREWFDQEVEGRARATGNPDGNRRGH